MEKRQIMSEFKPTKEDIKNMENEIKHLTHGKVKNKSFRYQMLEWVPDYRVICQYVFDKYGVWIAEVVFDENGDVFISPAMDGNYRVAADDVLLEPDYPKPEVHLKDDTKPLDIDNIASLSVVVAEPPSYKFA